jgi:hypothetical protein
VVAEAWRQRADSRRRASVGGACGLKKTKRRRGISFSPHVEASTEERATGEAATTKIDAGGRNSRTAAVRSVGDVRDPTNLNRCTSKPPMRRRSGRGELGSVTDGEEARAVAIA